MEKNLDLISMNDFDRFNEMSINDPEGFEKLNQDYINESKKIVWQPKHRPSNFYKQFDTGTIIKQKHACGKIFDYQINEYRGIIIKKCISNSEFVQKNYYTAHFKDDLDYEPICFKSFYLDKYEDNDYNIEGNLKTVLNYIDEALYWASDDLPYGTLYVEKYGNYKHKYFDSKSIRLYDNLIKILMANDFIVFSNSTFKGNASEQDLKIKNGRNLTPKGIITFTKLNNRLHTDDRLYKMILRKRFGNFSFSYTANKQINTLNDVMSAWDVFYNEMKSIDPSLFGTNTTKAFTVFDKYLHDFYN